MQITIDLTEEEVAHLDQISTDRKISREALLKSVLHAYLPSVPRKAQDDEERRLLQQAFGMWKNMKEDGLEYQDRLRNEWVRSEW